MSDLARWELRGPVRTVQTEGAEWIPESGEWGPLRSRTVATFRADGRLSEVEYHNPDGSVPRQVRVYDDAGRLAEEQWWLNGIPTRRDIYTYDLGGRSGSALTVDADGTTHETERWEHDDSGRRKKVVFLHAPEAGGAACSTGSCGTTYGIEGTDVAYSAPGATKSTTISDDEGRPTEVVFHDASDAVVSRVVFTRDQSGRVLSERMEFAGPGGVPGPAVDASMPADERDSLLELLRAAFDDQAFSHATYAYDGKGRRIESVRRMGKLSEERVAVCYDDFDNPVEEVRSDVSRRRRMVDGVVQSEDEASRVQHVRFEYAYDAHGNWTERTVWQRPGPDAEERPSNVERRTITYHGQ